MSLIIPVYNAENYISECLNSLLDQDVPREDYEIICVNDGSTDTSTEILQDFTNKYPNIVVIHKENRGVTTARNAGLDAARGEYIWFVDSDDFIKANILSTLRKKTAGTDCDRLIIGAYQFTDALSAEETDLSRQGKLVCNTSWYDAVVWRNLLRRSFLREHDLFFRYPDLTHGEDGLFMYEVTLNSPRSQEIEEVFYFYREHSGSAETAVSLQSQLKKLHSHIRITKILEAYFLSGHNSAPDSADKFMSFLWMSLYDISRLPACEARKYLNEMKQEGLFPYRRPEQCSLAHSYITDRTDFVGKVFDLLYLHLHTRWGYGIMQMLQQLLQLKSKIRK